MSIQRLMHDPTTVIPWRDENGPTNPFVPKAGTTKDIWTAIRESRVFVVEGDMDFPVDMLRYDRAFVLTPIPHPNHPTWRMTYRVVVGFHSGYQPTTARWNSFGWKVLDMEVPKDQADRLLCNSSRHPNKSCHRCLATLTSYTMSYFNRDLICPECDDVERAHPDFGLADASERHAIKHGDFNFEGIGWPGADVRVSCWLTCSDQ